MVHIVIENISPRLEYVCTQIFTYFMGVDYCFVKVDSNTTNTNNVFVINYTKHIVNGADLHIFPVDLLFENDVKKNVPEIKIVDESVKVFYTGKGQFEFDVFAAVFWMISRYEEYGATEFDKHHRFSAVQSMAHKYGFLHRPVVDEWVHDLSKYIEKKTGVVLNKPLPARLNTIDVDNAYAFLGKGFLRQMGACFKHLLKGDFSTLSYRMAVLRKKKTDPFDTYAYIQSVSEKYKLDTVFFHLVGKLDKHDRNISVNGKTYRKLIQRLKNWSVQGLHPSYASNQQVSRIKAEMQELGDVLNTRVEHSRQHFLRLKFPQTYTSLAQAGIKHDYTMGYADSIGFRAGTAKTYLFFNLIHNKTEHLTIHPFCVMDGTLKDYMKCSVSEAKQQVEVLKERLEKYNLPYVAIWHNETLSETNGWEGWREVYESQFK